jgi:prepilin peptidase CpaA
LSLLAVAGLRVRHNLLFQSQVSLGYKKFRSTYQRDLEHVAPTVFTTEKDGEMIVHPKVIIALLFIPLAGAIIYKDIRYRRIPNKLVFVTLLAGISLNLVFRGWHGLASSLEGMAVAFGMMFALHVFGTMGAGDVKLFAAVGAIVGISSVLQTLIIVALMGGLLALGKMIYVRRAGRTILGVVQFFYGLLPGQNVPRFEVPPDGSNTLPYAIPICLGALVSVFTFHA